MSRGRALSYRGEWLRIPPGEQLRCPCCLRTLRMHAHPAFVTWIRAKTRREVGATIPGGFSFHHDRCHRLIEWYSEVERRSPAIESTPPPA